MNNIFTPSIISVAGSLIQPITSMLDIAFVCSLGKQHRYKLNAKFEGNRIPTEIENKILSFISKKLQVDTSRIQIFSEDWSGSEMSVTGSLIDRGRGQIIIDKEVVDEIKKEFTQEYKFLIAHEVGHLIFGDGIEGDISKSISSNLASLVAYTISLIAIKRFYFGSLESFYPTLGTHIMCCMVAKLVSFATNNKINHNMEIAADKFACTAYHKLAGAGIEYFQKCDQEMQKNKETRTKGRNRVNNIINELDESITEIHKSIKQTKSLVKYGALIAGYGLKYFVLFPFKHIVLCERIYELIHEMRSYTQTHPSHSKRIASLAQLKK